MNDVIKKCEDVYYAAPEDPPTKNEEFAEAEFQSENEMAEHIATAMRDFYDYPDLDDSERVRTAITFRQASPFPTLREGLIIKMEDGSEYHVTVTKV